MLARRGRSDGSLSLHSGIVPDTSYTKKLHIRIDIIRVANVCFDFFKDNILMFFKFIVLKNSRFNFLGIRLQIFKAFV